MQIDFEKDELEIIKSLILDYKKTRIFANQELTESILNKIETTEKENFCNSEKHYYTTTINKSNYGKNRI